MSVAYSVMQTIDFEEQSRLARFKRAWDAYYGRYPKSLRQKPGEADDNIAVNYARVIVDVGVSYLFGQPVRFELSETSSTEGEAWLAGCWRANSQNTLLQKIGVAGGVCGHVFVKLAPPGAGETYPRLTIVDAASVTPSWAPDDIDRVTAYRVQYTTTDEAGKPLVRRQLMRRDGPRWSVVDQESRGDSPAWVTIGSAIWPHAWPPIVEAQNLPMPNEFWGLSDIEDDLLALNRATNFVLSNWNRIDRFHGHPRTWGRGFQAKQLDVGIDQTIILPGDTAELHNLEMTSNLEAHAKLADRLDRAALELARLPPIALGREETIPPSGVALQIKYQPLILKTEAKRCTYGDLLREIGRRLLAIGGFGEENETHIHWPELLPGDPQAEAQTYLLHQQLGVSSATLLEKLGYDPETERLKREAEAPTHAVPPPTAPQGAPTPPQGQGVGNNAPAPTPGAVQGL